MTIIANYECDNCGKIKDTMPVSVFMIVDIKSHSLHFCDSKCFRKYAANIEE